MLATVKNPFLFLQDAWRHRSLIFRLTRREIESRYKGSVLGILWSVIVPLMLLAVYTFVFSVIFQAKWDAKIDNRWQFALILFSGLIVFNVFSECINRAPGVMLNYVSYIKKVVFPLEILPWVLLFSSLYNAFLSFIILLAGHFIFIGVPPLTVLLIPLELLPFILLTLGLTLFLSSLGVYLRDLSQLISICTMILMFMSPIFYPITSIPEEYRGYISLSPIAVVIEGARGLIFYGQIPSVGQWLFSFACSWLIVWLGYIWFMKTRKGFADVV